MPDVGRCGLVVSAGTERLDSMGAATKWANAAQKPLHRRSVQWLWKRAMQVCRQPLRESQQTIPETPSPEAAPLRKQGRSKSRFTAAHGQGQQVRGRPACTWACSTGCLAWQRLDIPVPACASWQCRLHTRPVGWTGMSSRPH